MLAPAEGGCCVAGCCHDECCALSDGLGLSGFACCCCSAALKGALSFGGKRTGTMTADDALVAAATGGCRARSEVDESFVGIPCRRTLRRFFRRYV